MTLSAEEFIRRFLLHVLPNGFQMDAPKVRATGMVNAILKFRGDRRTVSLRSSNARSAGPGPNILRAATKTNIARMNVNDVANRRVSARILPASFEYRKSCPCAKSGNVPVSYDAQGGPRFLGRSASSGRSGRNF
jgi:hypothetical protein